MSYRPAREKKTGCIMGLTWAGSGCSDPFQRDEAPSLKSVLDFLRKMEVHVVDSVSKTSILRLLKLLCDRLETQVLSMSLNWSDWFVAS